MFSVLFFLSFVMKGKKLFFSSTPVLVCNSDSLFFVPRGFNVSTLL